MAYATPQNITTVSGMFTYVNTIVPEFFNLVIIALWVVSFLGLRGGAVSNGSAFATASFLTFAFTLAFQTGGLVSGQALFFLAVMCVIGIWFIMTSEAA